MLKKEFQIKNQMGFHMRPANQFVTAITPFASTDVTILFGGKRINAKSIMNIMAACIKCDSYITVECDGPEEEEAMKVATELIESGFGE